MDYKAKVSLMTKPGKLKGIASININDEFAIRGLKIYEGEKGPFISMPSRKIGEKFEDICFPITSEGREKMTEAVIKAYEQKLSQQEEQTHEEENTEKKSGKGKRQSHKQSDGQKENENREEMSEGQEEQTAHEPKIEM